MGVLEHDTTASILVDNPIIYTKSRTGSLYTRQHFWVAILEAAYHYIVIFFVSLGKFGQESRKLTNDPTLVLMLTAKLESGSVLELLLG